jgi:gamma-glutamyltranspeptidase/glutathione hydrolase
LAEDGFEFDSEHVRYFNRCAPKFDPQSIQSLFPGGATPRLGDRWRQPDLARLMRELAVEGPGAFYDGPITDSILRYLDERGGILAAEDFQSYRPQIDAPISATCADVVLYTPPPPSGGITSLSIVQTMERCGCRAMMPWNGEYFHTLAEASKLCWKERHELLSDPDFFNIPVDRLLSDDAAQARSQLIRSGQADHGASASDQSPHTANVIATDSEGNLVSLTATQGWMYGSHLVVDGLGLVLNHGMSRFDYTPGHPNAPAPGKRMQHNMSPMIALRNGRAAFAFGLPGGPKIVSVTAQLALSTVGFGSTPAAAITAPRLHTDGSEPLQVSEEMPADVVAELEQRGHEIRREADMGGPVNVLAIDPNTGEIDIASGETIGAVAGF